MPLVALISGRLYYLIFTQRGDVDTSDTINSSRNDRIDSQ